MLIPALARAAFGTLDPKLRPEGSTLLNLARLYGSTIGIAVVQIFFYNNTQAMHLALAKEPHAIPRRRPWLVQSLNRALPRLTAWSPSRRLS